MSFTDWTITGTGTCTLDGSTKYAGNSSLYLYVTDTSNVELTHNTFSRNQAQVTVYVRYNQSGSGTWYTRNLNVNLSTYGNLSAFATATETWERWRFTFWYDTVANIKWGRTEKWDGASWVQQGTDSNFGSGSPANGSLSFQTATSSGFPYTRTIYAWFDELEVYS